MLWTFLSHLPVLVLEMLAATLLILALGIIITLFAVLCSEVACRRVIRLVRAIAGVVNRQHVRRARRRSK